MLSKTGLFFEVGQRVVKLWSTVFHSILMKFGQKVLFFAKKDKNPNCYGLDTLKSKNFSKIDKRVIRELIHSYHLDVCLFENKLGNMLSRFVKLMAFLVKIMHQKYKFVYISMGKWAKMSPYWNRRNSKSEQKHLKRQVGP